ncbi:MAG: haloacid dehalogenase type II [Gammaproteobacteria bacterium]|nr:haloacid dehalogenase type II [Gammaproteobacteria bacterium]NIR85114.1 haloacid dehalogenase type II [Gammaproteobacteria bacterium]NIR92043.1 haloacid dehalogenase type II [Gammaproteobacteria bacterium]NIU06163.1 haloacid dehalogenase type II [Gammaproteobacteria bacterium]NIV53162.1 haloacid dehalogenase type II [Gammaproteobacteria bacterium]
MLDFERFTTLTFDCYGTLIDWERGGAFALRSLLSGHGVDAGEAEVIELFHRLQSRERTRGYRPYKEILADTVLGIAKHFGCRLDPGEMHALSESIGAWRPFPDTIRALRVLKTRYRLGVISNIDDDLFAETAERLQVPFDAVITAEQARCYKPAEGIFHLALERLRCSAAEVLHVGQWLEGDIIPARGLGMGTVWVRRSERSPQSSDEADVQVPDLDSLVRLLGVG